MSPSAHFAESSYREVFGCAQALREHRSAFRLELTSGEVDLVGLFERSSTDPAIASLKVLGAVESIPGFAKVQTRRAFADLAISEAALVKDLTVAQRSALPGALEVHAR